MDVTEAEIEAGTETFPHFAEMRRLKNMSKSETSRPRLQPWTEHVIGLLFLANFNG